MKDTIILTILIVLFTFSCANPGTPSGGPRDEDPPKIIKTIPENYSLNFNKKRITIRFNEFIKLNEPSKNTVISPPQKKKIKVKLRERAIVVDILDSLRANTTYTIDFGSAIEDNNEGNKLGEYRYVFSTGTKIDSMGLAGYVRDAKNNEPINEATVALYIPSDTLNTYHLFPQYMAKTDTLGFFMFNNIADKEYTILAFNDDSRNNMLDEDESVAFIRKNIRTSALPGEKTKDTIQLDKYTKFNNISIILRMFKPIHKKQYLKKYSRDEREKLIFSFNAPRKDKLGIELLDCKDDPNFIIESYNNGDSLVYWIGNEKVAQKDKLLARLSYLKTDSLLNQVSYIDTVKLNYKDKKKRKKYKKRKKDKKRKKEEKKKSFMHINTNIEDKVNYYDSLYLAFKHPVKGLSKEVIKLYNLKDSIEMPIKFSLTPDSILSARKFYINTELRTDAKYKIFIDSMKINNILGLHNDTFSKEFSTHPDSYYGKILLDLKGGVNNSVVQLLYKDNDKWKVKSQQLLKDKEGKYIVFKELPSGTYKLKIFIDRNGNKKWDTGNYALKQEPELVYVFKKEINLRTSWDQEVSWDITKK